MVIYEAGARDTRAVIAEVIARQITNKILPSLPSGIAGLYSYILAATGQCACPAVCLRNCVRLKKKGGICDGIYMGIEERSRTESSL